MSDVQWFSGPPPAVGWWPASTQGFRDFYRWWDGSNWSKAAHRSERISWVVDCAHVVDIANQRFIKWRHWAIDIDGTDGKGAHL